MQTITTIGLDIAKSVQVHGVDAGGQFLRRQLKRRYVLAFSRRCHHPLSASKLALRRTIRSASSRRSAIMYSCLNTTGLHEALGQAAEE